MSSETEAGLHYSHEILGDHPVIRHTIYSGGIWELPEEVTLTQLTNYIDPICIACVSLRELVSVSQSKRPDSQEDLPIIARCSLGEQWAVMDAQKPRYVNQQARCRLIDEDRLVHRTELSAVTDVDSQNK